MDRAEMFCANFLFDLQNINLTIKYRSKYEKVDIFVEKT